MSEHEEECRAFGMEWMNDRLQRVSRHDHRLATAIAMLDRHGVIGGPHLPIALRFKNLFLMIFSMMNFCPKKNNVTSKDCMEWFSLPRIRR